MDSLRQPLIAGESRSLDEQEGKQGHHSVMESRGAASPRSKVDGSNGPHPGGPTWFGALVHQWAVIITQLITGARATMIAMGGTMASAILLQPWLPVDQQHRIMSPRSRARLPPPPPLSPQLKHNLQLLKQRVGVPFNKENQQDEAMLHALWTSAYGNPPPSEANAVKGWKDMGWQGNHPATDFRGGGLLALENLLYYAQTYPRSFRRIMRKEEGKRAEWEYPFAAAGVNVTVLLIGLLELQAEYPVTPAGTAFLRYLEVDGSAFDDLYCLAFELLDLEWLNMRASYMEFNVVMKSLREKLIAVLNEPGKSSIQQLAPFHLLLRD